MPRNPHATDRIAGGSSTGSAVRSRPGSFRSRWAATAGVHPHPLALVRRLRHQADVGARQPQGRRLGGTVAHLGPLASSTLDLARVLEVDERPRSLGRRRAGAATGARRVRAARWARGVQRDASSGSWRGSGRTRRRRRRARGHDALRALEKEGACWWRCGSSSRAGGAAGYLAIAVEARAATREWRSSAPSSTATCDRYATLGQITAHGDTRLAAPPHGLRARDRAASSATSICSRCRPLRARRRG